MSSDTPDPTCLPDEVAALHARIRQLEEELRHARAALGSHTPQEQQQRVQVERQLLEHQHLESLNLLAGGLAHQFNNTLTAILGNAELALLDAPPGSELAYSLESILAGSRRAAQLTAQLLAYAGKGQIEAHAININELIHSCDSLLRIALPHRCTLRYRLGAPPPLAGDALQLRQVLLSLVSNAAEAIEPPDGEISVETETLELGRAALDRLLFGQEREPGRYLRLTVRDNGSGIEAKTLERIFVPFFSTRFAGRGLGLAAVQGIVRGHKGALRVESTPGQGTIFSVYLPSLSTWHERAP